MRELEIQGEVLPKSPEGRAVRYTLKNWTALTRYCEDGDLQIDRYRFCSLYLATDRLWKTVYFQLEPAIMAAWCYGQLTTFDFRRSRVFGLSNN
jgi:hypothetical protein